LFAVCDRRHWKIVLMLWTETKV